MRDVTKLHPELQHKIKKLIKKCDEQGLKIQITECVRSIEEQDALYQKGRTVKGNIVTNAKGSTYSSCHQWAIAFDICRADGKGAYDDSDGFFTKVGTIGESLGLIWGGSWVSIKDKPHFQLKYFGDTTTLLKQYFGTPEKFMKVWGWKSEITVNAAMRKNAKITGEKIMTVKKGTPITILDKGKKYNKVMVDGKFGYIAVKKMK